MVAVQITPPSEPPLVVRVGSTKTGETEMRPNVLVIVCDQLRADALGCYGNTIVRTPAIDRLAAEGTVFDSAYTPSPVCVPSRASLISGNEPQTNECFENTWAMPDTPTFMDDFTNAGYRTHGVGKMHFMPEGRAMRGFQTRDHGEEFGTCDDDDYLAYLAANGYGQVEKPHGLRDEMYYIPQLSPVPEEHHFSHWVADKSIDFIDSTGDQPFMLWSSFIAPHPPFAPPSPWHRLLEPSLMPDPHEPIGGDGLLTVYNTLQSRYKYRDGGRDRRLWQLIRAYYWSSVSYLDTQVDRILRHLEETGRRENTIVLLTADHGEFLGDYGTFGKRSFLDSAARIPMIVSGPGFAPERRSAPVSITDVRPTLTEAAGIDIEAVDGVALQHSEPDRIVFGQYQQGDLGLYAVITSQWKYMWSAPDAREYLLDREHDRQETRNLAYNTRVRQTLEELRAIAVGHFTDLEGLNLDSASGNVRLGLGEPPSDDRLRALRALDVDPDSGTLVVQWNEPEFLASDRND